MADALTPAATAAASAAESLAAAATAGQAESACQQAHTLLVVLLGLPGAGKTTLAGWLCEAAARQGVTAHHLCLDELLQQHTAAAAAAAAAAEDEEVAEQGNQGQQCQQASPTAFSADAWQVCRQRLLSQVEDLLQQQQQQYPLPPPPQQQQQQQQLRSPQPPPQQQQQQQRSASVRQLIIVDDNNFYHSMRYQFFQLARKYSAAFLQLHLDCQIDLALQRNRQRSGAARLPDAVLQRCADAFEPPDPQLRKWEEGRTWTLQVEQLPQGTASSACCEGVSNRLWQQLQQHWGPAVPPLPDPSELQAARAAATATNLASRVHQADLQTRAVLNAAVAHVPQDRKAAVAKALNEARKQMLQQLRQQQQQQQQQTIASSSSSPTDDSTASSTVGVVVTMASDGDCSGSRVDEWAAAFQYLCMQHCETS